MEKQINRRHAHYNDAVKPALQEKFGYANVMEIPRLDKIVLSLRLGKEKDNSKSFNIAVDELSGISSILAIDSLLPSGPITTETKLVILEMISQHSSII